MHVYNFKVKKNKIFKGILLFFILICLIIFIYSGFKLYTEMKNLGKENFVVDDPYFETRQTNQYRI